MSERLLTDAELDVMQIWAVDEWGTDSAWPRLVAEIRSLRAENNRLRVERDHLLGTIEAVSDLFEQRSVEARWLLADLPKADKP